MQSSDYFEFFNHAKTISGILALEHITHELNDLSVKKPLILMKKRYSKAGLGKTIINAFKDSDIVIGAVYDAIPEYAGINAINDLSILYKDRGCDSIIAVGDGSTMDIAKGLNIIVSGNNSSLFDYSGTDKIDKKLKPLIAVITAKASGRETSNSAIIDGRFFKSDFLFPDLIAIDPRMTRSDNSVSIAESAMIALTHSIEANAEPYGNPMSDSYAHTSISLIYENLFRGVKKPNDKKATMALANSFSIGGIVYSNSPAGIVHHLSEALSDVTGYPAGQFMGFLLPLSLENKINKKGINLREELLLAMKGIDTYCETPEKERAALAIDLIKKLLKNLDGILAQSLTELNIPEYKLEEAVKIAVEKSDKIFSAKDCVALLGNAR